MTDQITPYVQEPQELKDLIDTTADVSNMLCTCKTHGTSWVC